MYNATGRTWTKGSAYFDSGTSDSLLPYEVCQNSSFKYTGRKTKAFKPTGVVGVIAYNMEGGGTLAIMFSVPWDTNVLYDPYWNVEIFSDIADAKASIAMFKKLYQEKDPFKGNDSWRHKSLNDKYFVQGVMTSSHSSTLKIIVVSRKHNDDMKAKELNDY